VIKQKSLFLPITSLILAFLLLFALNFSLSGTAKENEKAQLTKMMQIILPNSKSFKEEEYKGDDSNIVRVFKSENGYVVETVTYGYAGDIEMLIGVNSSGYITGLVVKELHETIGLGANALYDTDFLRQFENTKGDAVVGENFDAISGATVTSRAIAKAVNSASGFVTGTDTNSGATQWGH